MKTKTKCLLLLALGSFGFGVGSAVLKRMLLEFPQLHSIDVVFLRLFFSGLCLLLLGTFQQKQLPVIHKSDMKRFAAMGILGIFVVQFFLMWAVSQIYVGLATFVQATATLMICAYSVIFLKERMTRWKSAAVLLGFLGLLVILWSPEILQSENLFNIGVLAALLSAVGKCFYILYGKLLQRQYPTMIMVGYAMLFGAAFSLIFARPWRMFVQYDGDLHLIGYLSIYILLCTSLPFVLYFTGLEKVPASVAGITNCVEPVGGTMMAFLWAGELLKTTQLLGMGMILAGVLLAQGEIIKAERES